MKKVVEFFLYINRYCKIAVIALVLLNVVGAFGYIYLINDTVHTTVAYDKMQESLTEQHSVLAEMQSHYMQLSSVITLEFAYSQGFVDANGRHAFISPESLSHTVSFNAN